MVGKEKARGAGIPEVAGSLSELPGVLVSAVGRAWRLGRNKNCWFGMSWNDPKKNHPLRSPLRGIPKLFIPNTRNGPEKHLPRFGGLLDRIAVGGFHALIDTGTGRKGGLDELESCGIFSGKPLPESAIIFIHSVDGLRNLE